MTAPTTADAVARITAALGNMPDATVLLYSGFGAGEWRHAFTVADLRAVLARLAECEGRTCAWREPDGYHSDAWETACGEAWTFIAGGVTENNVRFCNGCGARVVVVPFVPDREYPLPPRECVLSDGSVVTYTSAPDRALRPFTLTRGGCTLYGNHPFAWAENATDARNLADFAESFAAGVGR